MKNIYSKLALLALGTSLVATSCIEETFPTSGVTTEQIGQNSQGLEGIVQGMPAFMKKYHTWNTQAFNFGYPSIMIMTDVMTQDYINNPTGYDWFSFWSEVSMGLDSGYIFSQINWYYLNFMVRSANDVVSAIGEPDNDQKKAWLAQAYIYRSSTYLDMARIYECLPNDRVPTTNESGTNVEGLTVPYTTPDMSEDEVANNPRRTRAEMVELLEKDLQYAIQLYGETDAKAESKVYPSLACAYGVMARLYLWNEDYAKAADYARKAINESGATPLTQAQYLDVKDGFNNSSFSAWMWAIQYESEDDPVNSSDNWASFQCPETNIGYGGEHDAYFLIDRSLYDQIKDADFRKLTFKAPEGSSLSGREAVGYPARYAEFEPYTCFKFRPGQGNVSDPTTAYAIAIPLMRVEEMYFIEAEALAHTNAAAGISALTNFMTTYRYAYRCPVTAGSPLEDVIAEIILQKRIEFVGEGKTFFDIKRLNMGVNRAYEGTNWPDTQLFNTGDVRPGWMNWPFVDYEGDFNMGVRGKLNPNISGYYADPIVMEE